MKNEKTVAKKMESTETSDGHGGKRKGAGRPLSANPKKGRFMKIRDEDWELIMKKAGKAKLSAGDYFVFLNTGKAPSDE